MKFIRIGASYHALAESGLTLCGARAEGMAGRLPPDARLCSVCRTALRGEAKEHQPKPLPRAANHNQKDLF